MGEDVERVDRGVDRGVGEAGGVEQLPGEHLRGHVDADHRALGADRLGGDEALPSPVNGSSTSARVAGSTDVGL